MELGFTFTRACSDPGARPTIPFQAQHRPRLEPFPRVFHDSPGLRGLGSTAPCYEPLPAGCSFQRQHSDFSSYPNRQTSASRSPLIRKLLLRTFRLGADLGLQLAAKHIPWVKNIRADRLSREKPPPGTHFILHQLSRERQQGPRPATCLHILLFRSSSPCLRAGPAIQPDYERCDSSAIITLGSHTPGLPRAGQGGHTQPQAPAQSLAHPRKATFGRRCSAALVSLHRGSKHSAFILPL